MGSTIFQYTPLDRPTHSIRLLRLLPCSAEMDYALETYDINETPPYIALSYVWGIDEPTHEIRLNGRVFLVRDNLWHALLRLAGELPLGPATERLRDRYFWIDALCINQNDLLERGHQVDLMGFIFSKADITIAWLGLAMDDSDFAMESLKLNPHALDDDDVPFFDRKYERSHMDCAIKSLLTRDYFSRMWVVQEILLARDVLIICGSTCRYWDFLARYARGNLSIDNPFKPYIPNSAQALITARADLKSKKHSQPQLGVFLMQFGRAKCSDARDRVYGLLGLIRATHPDSTIPPADYTISTVQLYFSVMNFMQREQVFASQDPRYTEEVSILLATNLELPRDIHQSISAIYTITYRFGSDLKYLGFCEFPALLRQCILPLEVICNTKLTSPFNYSAKYEEMTRKLKSHPINDSPKMWFEFKQALVSLLMVWGIYMHSDPEMKHIPSTLKVVEQRQGKFCPVYQRQPRRIRSLLIRMLHLQGRWERR